MVVPEGARRAVVAILLLLTVAAHIWFTLRIVGDTLDAADGRAPIYDAYFSYWAGLLASLVATPAAIAFGQAAPKLPDEPGRKTRPLNARLNILGAAVAAKERRVASGSQIMGVLYLAVWLLTGLYALATWFGNRDEASVAHYALATAFSGIAIAIVVSAVRPKPAAP